MFGSLKSLFAAIGGLAESITETRRLFDSANEQLRQRLAIDPTVDEEGPALLEHQPGTNGSTKPASPGGRSTRTRSK